MNLFLNRWLSLFSVLSATLPALSFASPGDISNNPDDYDVPRYQRLYQDSQARVVNAQTLLQNLVARAEAAGRNYDRESNQVQALEAQIQAQRNIVLNASARIQSIKDEMQRGQADMVQILAELNSIESLITVEQEKNEVLRTRLDQMVETFEQLDQVARDKEAGLAPLQAVVTQKQQALAAANAELKKAQDLANTLKTRIAQIQAQQTTLRATVSQLDAELPRLQAAKENLERTIPEKEAKLVELEQLATAAEETARQNPSVGNVAAARAARARANGVKADIDKNKQDLAAMGPKIAAKQQQRDDAAATDANLENQRVQHVQQLADVNSDQVDPAQAEVASATAALTQAQGALAAVSGDANRARAAANQAKAGVDGVTRAVADSDRAIAALMQRPAVLQARQMRIQQMMAQNAQELPRQESIIQEARAQVPRIAALLERQQRELALAQRDLGLAVRDRDQAADVVRQSAQASEVARQRLIQVQENLRRGIEVATADGERDGTDRGDYDGQEQGAAKGDRDGREVGAREGHERGTADGVQQARDAGTLAGSTKGLSDGAAAGTPEGQRLGKNDGTAKGRAEGLLAGYEQGRAEGDATGYREGTAAGHQQGGLARGRTEGIAQGSARATSEANTKGKPEGYAAAEAEFLNANLTEATISNKTGRAPSDVFANAKSVQAQQAKAAQNYPHPGMQAAYEQGYRRGYDAAAASGFDRAYKQSYDATYGPVYMETYNTALRQDFSRERKVAYDQAYATSFAQAKKQAFDVAYQAAHRTAYEAAFNLASGERRDEGRRDGRAQGQARGQSEALAEDIARGRDEGNVTGYNDTYPRAYETAKREGREEAVRFYSANAVLKFDGALLADSNRDGIVAPGEALTITMVIKNFGKVVQANSKDLTIQITGASAGLLIEKPADTLAKIGGQTRTTVVGIGQIRVRADTQVGREESVTITVSQAGQTLGNVRLAVSTGHPYAIPLAQTGDLVTAARDNEVLVQVKNVSSRLSGANVVLRLVSLDRLASVTRSDIDLGRIEAGGTVEARVAFTFGAENAFKKLNFEVQTLEGASILGRRQLTVESARRWTFDPNASGLLVISTADQARSVQEAARLSGLALDLFDLRVEGQLTAAAVSKYLGTKLVVVPAVTTQMTASTADAVKTLIAQGGRLVVGLATGGETSAVGVAIADATKDLGTTTLGDLTIRQGNFFRATDGTAIVITGSVSATPAALADRLMAAKAIAGTVSEKISLAAISRAAGNASRATTALHAIVRELVKEMNDDKALNTEHFKKRLFSVSSG